MSSSLDVHTQGINGTDIVTGGVYRLTNTNSDLVLDVDGVSKASEANVQVWESNGGLNQQWLVVDAGGGYATLKAQHSNLCLDAKGGGWQSGANVQQYTCNNSGAQQWKFVSVGSGVYKLLNRNANMALNVQDGGKTNGANVQVNTDTGNAAQQWKLERLGGDSTGGGGSAPSTVKTSYTADTTTNFPNPERGYYTAYNVPWPSNDHWDYCGQGNNATAYNYTALTPDLDSAKLKARAQAGESMVSQRYHIAAFRGGDLSSDFLQNHLQADFDKVRAAGLKLVPRFVYNWPKGGPDASLNIVLRHLDQLGPVLQKNADVLAFMEAGFIGCWGEWNNTTNNLLSGGVNDATRKIIDKLLSAVPGERMVAIRYPYYKSQYFGTSGYATATPVSSTEAYGGGAKARLGHHDDCLVCGEFNASTYGWSGDPAYGKSITENFKNYLAQENVHLVQNGEPGDPDTSPNNADLDGDGYTGGQYASCERVVWGRSGTPGLLPRLHWSAMNSYYGDNYDNAAYKTWKNEGCYDTIAKKLGYRYRLVESNIPTGVTRGGKLSLNIKVTNDGWASAYNPRAVEIILRNKASGQKVVISQPVSSDHEQDPRFWLPGETHSITLSDYTVPGDLPAGQYEVLLNLPDPMPNLHGRPEYSIRLANQNTWEATTGYNNLLRAFDVR